MMAVLLEKRGVARLALSSAHQLQAVVTLVVHDFHGLMLGEGKIDCADSEDDRRLMATGSAGLEIDGYATRIVATRSDGSCHVYFVTTGPIFGFNR